MPSERGFYVRGGRISLNFQHGAPAAVACKMLPSRNLQAQERSPMALNGFNICDLKKQEAKADELAAQAFIRGVEVGNFDERLSGQAPAPVRQAVMGSWLRSLPIA